jgi:hypothetical protein
MEKNKVSKHIINTVLSAQAMAVLKSLDHYNGRCFSKLSDPLDGIVGTEQRGNCAITRLELKRALDYLCKQDLIKLKPLNGGDFKIEVVEDKKTIQEER